MRATSILRQVVGELDGQVHRSRLKALTAAVMALIRGGKVGLSALGKAIARGSYKHGIKRIDRLLGNPALANEVETFYGAITRYVLRGEKRPVILLDWTKVGESMCGLTAAVPVQGRAIAILTVTVPLSKWTSREVENRFLETLRSMLRPDCRPILVGDAGFRAPWMRFVQKLKWDFVARIRGRTLVQKTDAVNWQRWTELWHHARRKPRDLGQFRIVRARPIEARIIAVDGRSSRARSSGPYYSNSRVRKLSKGHREPWFLATTIDLPAEQIAAMYCARMQIELTFRDLKSHRYGWAFEDARCGSANRVAIQILIATLASIVAIIIGLAVEEAGMRKRFQANTTKRRVLSLVALGRAALVLLQDEISNLPNVDLSRHRPFVGIH